VVTVGLFGRSGDRPGKDRFGLFPSPGEEPGAHRAMARGGESGGESGGEEGGIEGAGFSEGEGGNGMAEILEGVFEEKG
jgi:hypothetical protein